MGKSFCVYIHTTPSNKRYVGITSNKPESRWNEGRGYKCNPAFYNAILKYGWNNISHEIVADGLAEEKAKNMEIALISKYMTRSNKYGYNCTDGGDGKTGYKVTEETKSKISAAHMGKRLSDETKAKLSDINKGKCLSEEHKAKISSANKGKHSANIVGAGSGKRLSAEHRAKISAALTGKHLSNETKLKLSAATKGKRASAETKAKLIASHKPYMKAVYQYTVNGEMVRVWESRSSALKGFRPGKMSSGIAECIAGRIARAYGYFWSYIPTQSEVVKSGKV